MEQRQGPVLIETDAAGPSPSDAPPVAEPAPEGAAMQAALSLGAGRPSILRRWFFRAFAAFVGFAVSLAAWDFVSGLVSRNPVLGGIASVLLAVLVLTALGLILRELAALSRLRRLDSIHHAADAALTANDPGEARKVADRIAALYRGRDDLAWGLSRLNERQAEMFDADAVLGLVERELLAALDARARREVEAAARQVATVTALVPVALADVAAALAANLRMIRRIAEIYGGRSGTLGAWRLTRAVFAHLMATGAVAVGDDLLGSVGGGHLLSRISRRFGEGLVNGALTARVGIAAMEVCRPLPFRVERRPSVTRLVQRALTGLFGDRDTAPPGT